MDLFDTILENFSSKDLVTRVKGVVLFGLALTIVIGLASSWFLKETYQMSLAGAGRVSPIDSDVFEIHLSPEQIELLADRTILDLELLDHDQGFIAASTSVLMMEPQNGLLLTDARTLPLAADAPANIDLRVILFQKPIWKLLWSGESIKP